MLQTDVEEALRAVLLATHGITDFSRPAFTATQLRDLVAQARIATGAKIVLLGDTTGGKSYHLNVIPVSDTALPDNGGSRPRTTHDEMFIYISRFGPLAQRYWNRYNALGEPTLYYTAPSPETKIIDAALQRVVAQFGLRLLNWDEAGMLAPRIISDQPEGARVGQLLFTAM